jgi:hypothetical protein
VRIIVFRHLVQRLRGIVGEEVPRVASAGEVFAHELRPEQHPTAVVGG